MTEIRPFTRFVESLRRKELIGVEIGVMGGANALTFLEILDIKYLYLIDIFDSYNELRGHGVLNSSKEGLLCYEGSKKRLQAYEDKLIWLIELSENAAAYIKHNLDFVYLDGNHRYEYVKKDIDLYLPKVRSGGVIGGHDYKSLELGVIRAVNESFPKNKINNDGWDWWVVKE